MAARATRSASGVASSSDDDSRCLLLALSHDELGVIVDGLADPLQPVVAVALSSTCLGLRTPLRLALEVLKERHERAAALCRKMLTSCASVRVSELLSWNIKDMNSWNDMTTLNMILRTNGLPRLQRLYLGSNFGDAGIQGLCEGLGHGAAPLLRLLHLSDNQFGPLGAEALSAALRRGAMPKLETLWLSHNPIGNQGLAALAAPLRARPALKELRLVKSELGDEGVASLVANLGKDDFKKLERLYLVDNSLNYTLKSCRTLVSVIDEGGLPALGEIGVFSDYNPASALGAGQKALEDALIARRGACMLK